MESVTWSRIRLACVLRLSGQLAAIALLMLIGTALPARAQGGDAPPPVARGERGAVPDVAALQDLFDSYVLVQAQRQLQLTLEQEPQFILKLRDLQAVRRRHALLRIRLLQALRRQVQSAGPRNDDQIRTRLQALDAADEQAARDVKQAVDGLDQVLTVAQQARFRLLEEQMERRKLEILLQARRAAGGRAKPF